MGPSSSRVVAATSSASCLARRRIEGRRRDVHVVRHELDARLREEAPLGPDDVREVVVSGEPAEAKHPWDEEEVMAHAWVPRGFDA